MIHIQNGRLAFGSQVLFSDLALSIAQTHRVGVLGRNGTGKSTLLKIIAGQASLDEGTVTLDRNKKIAYMPQEMVVLSTKTVFDETLSVFEALITLEKEKKDLEERLDQGLGQGADMVQRYAELQESSFSFDVANAQAKTEQVLKGLGFTAAMFEQSVEQLSVGWKMRLVLAKLLLQNADFYLFDEPTNHLDLPTKEWFFEFLKDGNFGFLMVSHDRHYLEKACDYILALEHSKAVYFRGNLSAYLTMRENQQAVLQSAHARQQKELARKQATIERFRASASKARMAQSMIKQLEKIERIELEPMLPTISLNFPPTTRPGSVVLSLKNIEHAFDERVLFRNVQGTIARGERVALVAPNGMGKTTLFSLISGALPLTHGTVTFGTNVTTAVFEQDQMRALNPDHTVYEEVLAAAPAVAESTIRTFLGSFLFSGETVRKKISVLSGGERNRVAMVKVLLQKANFLLLDEPTNHLDLYAKDVLLQALKQYQGTILFVSHDQSFLEQCATALWELTPSGIHSYPGTYESYLYAKKVQNREHTPSINKQEVKRSLSSKEENELRKQITQLESKIEKLEREIQHLHEQFAHLEYGTQEYQKTAKKLEIAQSQLKEYAALWERLIEDKT